MANSADSDQKPTGLDLHCLQRQGISGFSMTRVKRRLQSIYELQLVVLIEHNLWEIITVRKLNRDPIWSQNVQTSDPVTFFVLSVHFWL